MMAGTVRDSFQGGLREHQDAAYMAHGSHVARTARLHRLKMTGDTAWSLLFLNTLHLDLRFHEHRLPIRVVDLKL
jgi:hypothetical protein